MAELVFTLAMTMTAALLATMIRKLFAERTIGKKLAPWIFNTLISLVSAIVLLVWGGIGQASTFTWLFGILFGVVATLQTITNLKALEMGPMSYTTVVISCATLISALSGALFFNEKLVWAHIVGIILMVISFFLAVDKQKDEKGASFRWLLMSLLSMILNGCIGIMQKVHQSSSYKSELNIFLVIAFAASFLLSLAFTLLMWGKDRNCSKATSAADPYSDRRKSIGLLVCTILGGICIAVNHKLNLYLSGVMDSAVFFPLVNGGGLVLTTLAAMIFFREKLNRKQWIGVILGTLSVVFLCNPFSFLQ